MSHRRKRVNIPRDLRGWPLADLVDFALEFRRSAADFHYSPREWRALDRVRKRIVALQREGAL